jgi:LysR family nitrogen assimilation transcriptional regulator
MLFGAARLMNGMPDVVQLKDIASLPLVAPDRAHDARKIVERIAANAGLPLQIRYELNSPSMLVGVVKEGLAFAILPTSICVDAVASGALARRPVDSSQLARMQAIVWLDERPLSPAAAAVKNELARTVADLVGKGLLEGRSAAPDAGFAGAPVA